jgi:hypothetical protein
MNLMDAWHVPPKVRDLYGRVSELYGAIEHKLYFETPMREMEKIRLIPSFPNCEDQAEIFASVFPELRARILIIGSKLLRTDDFHAMTHEEFREKWGNYFKDHAWCRIYGVASFAIDPRPIGILSGPVLQSLDWFNYHYVELEYSVLRSKAHRMRLEMWKRIARREAEKLKLI